MSVSAPPYDYQPDKGVYEQRAPEPTRRAMRYFTAFLALSETPRGTYDEEIDVRALNASAARRIAEAIAAGSDFVDGVVVRRVEERFGWFL